MTTNAIRNSVLLVSVLLVEDDSLVASSLARMLRLKKFDVSICPDPKKALELCDKRQFDLIITDQKMPVMTGTEFAAIAKDRQPNARTLLISGYIDEKDAAAALENDHINRFVSKPWHNEDILSIVESELQIGSTLLTKKMIEPESILLKAS